MNNLNYQSLLDIDYIFKLVNSILVVENVYKFKIICKEKKYYIESKYNDLIYINDVNFLQGYYKRFKQILDTLLVFEHYKNNPLELYLNRLKYTSNNLDMELLYSLQNQFILDSTYFNKSKVF